MEPNEPFNPKSISIDTKGLLVQSVINRLHQKTLRLAPDFQRNELWNITQKSRLIESLLLKIPLPMFYVAADEKGQFDVVDGMQRLSALRDFLYENGDTSKEHNGKGFKLEQLEFITDLNGLTFSDLDFFYKNRILETELAFTIINPGTPEDVKFTIFSRVNTGGLALTDQEVRHALYNGKSTTLLAELANNDFFLEATGGKFNSERMEDREVILRMLSFVIRDYKIYPERGKKMSDFISETMIIINSMPDFNSPRFKKNFSQDDINTFQVTTTNALRDKFINGMQRAYRLFGDHAFRRSLPGTAKTRLNKALFDTWGSSLAKLDNDSFKRLNLNKSSLLNEYRTLLSRQTFGDDISRYALYPEHIKSRFEKIEKIIDGTIRGTL